MRQQSARIAVIQVNKHTPHYLPLSVYHTLVVVDTFHSLSLHPSHFVYSVSALTKYETQLKKTMCLQLLSASLSFQLIR